MGETGFELILDRMNEDEVPVAQKQYDIDKAYQESIQNSGNTNTISSNRSPDLPHKNSAPKSTISSGPFNHNSGNSLL